MMQPFTGSGTEWDQILARLPGPHLLQTWEWAQVKSAFGWEPLPFLWKDEQGSTLAAAMALKRRILSRGLAARLCMLYLPKGPLLDWSDDPLRDRVLDDLQAWARSQGAIFLKIDPDVLLGLGVPGSPDSREQADGQRLISNLRRRGWLYSSDQIQFRNTVLLDLSVSEEQLMSNMKQKARYNIRLAEKKGVTVRRGGISDLPLLYRMYAETAVRDGFVVRSEDYYQKVWTTFLESQDPGAEALVAEVEAEPAAALFVFYFSGRAYYLYGMSRQLHREKMPNYLLQWRAIQRARARGARTYDLWGAPEVFDGRDPLWGVYRFKDGLGGQLVRTLGAWDFPASPAWYGIYTRLIPRLLDLMRMRGRRKTEQMIGGA